MAVQFINRQETLEITIHSLEQAEQIALDLEFDKNYYRYGFNLCLMQLYDGKNCYLIDPLSNDLNIETVFPVLENRSIQKVAFAFGEDLRLLHSLGCFPKDIYDLDIAISLLNYSPASLTNHLADILGIETGKSTQMSNWYKRPLTDQQTAYASEDVLYLLDLKHVLEKQAEQKQISHWIEEENRCWDELDFSGVENGGIKEKDKQDLTEKEWHIYTRLIETREELSEKLNKPSFQVIKKDVIYQIAKEPEKLERWTSTRGIFKRLRNEKIKTKMEETVQKAEKEALKNGYSETDPASKPSTREERKRYQAVNQKISRAKEEFFNPVKEQITADYGKEVSTYLFSNRIIAGLVSTEQPEIENYKANLLKRYAEKLDLDMNRHLQI